MATSPTPRAKATPKAAAPQIAPVTPEHAESVAQAQTAALKSYEDVVGFSKDALEAWAQSGSVLSRGLQDIGQKFFGLAQAVIEQNINASKQLLTVKTIREVVDLHQSLSKEQVEHLLAEGSHLSDLSIKLVEESLAPISQKVNELIGRLSHKG